MEFKGIKGEWKVGIQKKEAKENAKLRAAAPELLEALQEVLENDLSENNITTLSLHTRAFIQNRINKALN